MNGYVINKKVDRIPRIPLKGMLDLTYRCNNDCRHCWLRIPAESPERKNELDLEKIREIVDEARKMGCREWNISGGEPMLRPDFMEIFDYVTTKSALYSINTNGTLITPRIARLLKRKGTKMIALYGADAKIHDHITRNPGSFDAAMRGFAYLKEAGAGFIVQLIPMRDNYHQFDEMVRLAQSLSQYWRIGAAWLHMSADGDRERNQEILRQRLDPEDVVELDRPDFSNEIVMKGQKKKLCCHEGKEDFIFASCIASRRDFHVDPYGKMSFCCFIKDKAMRYDLKEGSFNECWEKFIPLLADKVRGGKEYRQNCGSCSNRSMCRWCPAYGYLEHGRFSAKIDYLCDVARENRKLKENLWKNHRKYYQIAGITIQVDSDLPITDSTFHPKFKSFEANGPGEDNIILRHRFFLPDLNEQDLWNKVCHGESMKVYRNGNSWIYKNIRTSFADEQLYKVISVFNHGHTKGTIYSEKDEYFRKGGMESLSFFSTDQILLARVLADRKGCIVHSSGAAFEGKGFLFVGRSGAGKSTIASMLRHRANIIGPDRIIAKRWEDGFRIHGTWNNIRWPEISSASASLEAIFFLHHAKDNRSIPVEDKMTIIKKLLPCLIKPMVTADWWEKMLALAEQIANEVPCYDLMFDKSGKAVDLISPCFKP